MVLASGGVDVASLLGWIWTDGGFDNTGNGVRIWQSESANPEKVKEIDELMSKTVINHKRYDRDRIYTYKEVNKDVSETCWFFTGEMSVVVRNFLPNKKLSWDLIWKMSIDEKIAFYEASMKGDGSGMTFYQKDENDLLIFQSLCHLIGKQGRLGTKKKKKCVHIHNNPTTELQNRHLKSTKTVQYEGLVWCVSVDTGAFVAKKNGKIFITGNSGFPKSLDVSKAIDKAAGAEREVVGANPNHRPTSGVSYSGVYAGGNTGSRYITAAATDAAKQWHGFGTALKPAFEPIVLARKPLEGTVADNVLEHGVGAINIDGCRVETNDDIQTNSRGRGYEGASFGKMNPMPSRKQPGQEIGRFPANLIHDGSDEVVSLFPDSKGQIAPVKGTEKSHTGETGIYGTYGRTSFDKREETETSAARFFYCAKASAADRDEGLDDFELKKAAGLPMRSAGVESTGEGLDGTKTHRDTKRKNIHPTTKPTTLMRYLCKLITPPGGTILDPFMGSGSTGKAAMYEGFDFVGVEMMPEYMEIAEARIAFAKKDAFEISIGTKKSKSKKNEAPTESDVDITKFFE